MSRSRKEPAKSDQDRYLVGAVLRACDVLEAFAADGELLRMSDVAARTGLSRPTALRLLHTLESRGLVARVGRHQYRLEIRPLKRRLYRFGFGSLATEFAFSRDVTDSISKAARAESVEMLVLDNRYSAKTAIRNAEIFIREGVDVVIEFQADRQVAAPIISSKLMAAKIPLIAVDIPHPGASYYGVNNYAAGLAGGRFLGKWAKQNWGGVVDEVLILELPKAGPVPALRLAGTLAGILEMIPGVSDSQVFRIDGNGQFGRSIEAVRKRLRSSRARRVLVGAINDHGALGALRAFEESGRLAECAVMSQGASMEARAEMRRPGSRLVGAVAYFPEAYGEGVIGMGIDSVRNKPVPPAVFIRHRLITAESVNRFYPNDILIAPGDLDTMLLSKGRRLQ